MTRIVELQARDIRFPTSRSLDGSDAMNPDPDYSAAYVVLRTDADDGLEGHGLTFTIGRGTEVVVAAVDALRPLVVGLDMEATEADLGAFWLISQRILPPIAIAIPLYVLFQQVGLLDSLWALIITYVAANLPIVVWLMRDYFASLPRELEESAAVDGASVYRIVRSIVLPISVPGLVATFLIVLIFAWNEFLIALVLTSANAQTMPLQVAAQNATRGPQWWAMSVLIIIMITPVVVMAVALERFITRGILVGALKG